jgi:F-type H+-transporting ATPase subunit a
MFILNTLQEESHAPSQHGAEAAAEASHAGGHGEHVPILVEKLNELLGPAVFELQAKIMPPIYKVFGFIFGGDHWPGAGLSFEQYREAGNLPIPTHVVMFLFVVFLAVVLLTFLRGKLSAESPTKRQQTFEVGVETIRSLLGDLVGPSGMRHFPVVATFAILILLSNLTGFLPDMIAPTANFNMTLALALTSFLYYNFVGIKENGLIGHLKHLCGPIWWMAWLMFPIELVSNMARILSLSMRLFGNIYGEEQVSGTIATMVQWIVPILIMPLGLLTALLQTFIFILLSMIYLGEVSHHSEEHGHEKDAALAAAH